MPGKRSGPPVALGGAANTSLVVARSVPRGYDDCRRYGGCWPGARCVEHSGDPVRLGDLLVELYPEPPLSAADLELVERQRVRQARHVWRDER